MSTISKNEANRHLSELGMEIGEWNRITYMSKEREPFWINAAAPKNARELFNYSQHVASWLPQGKWKILQVDDSTWPDAVQSSIFKAFLGSEKIESVDIAGKSFLFELSETPQRDKAELLISHLIFFFLLFEQHGYLVSSGSVNGELLSLQDGFVYFYSKNQDVSGARSLLSDFKNNPRSYAGWVSDIVAAAQEKDIALFPKRK